MLSVSVNTQNRIINAGFTYDAAGNLTADGSHTYQWDAESRMKSLDSTAATYTYDANGNRVRKQVASDSTEYIYFAGQVITERHANGDWSDYIFAGSRRLAKVDTYEDRIRVWGTRCSGCGYTYANFTLPSAAGHAGYVMQASDKLYFNQWQTGAARGGIYFGFTDGTYAAWNVYDQDGQVINSDTYSNVWHYRRVDLSAFAGKTLSEITLRLEGDSAAGFNEIYYRDIALVSVDGTVRVIYNSGKTVTLSSYAAPGMTGVGFEVNHWQATTMAWAKTTTTYNHGDHLGSSRLTSNYDGYPTWSATYLPFGQEHNPQPTTNHYKFTGKERDAESNLDYFGARYFASALGRFTSPDLPFADQSADDPQSWNLYAYVRNNPLRNVDPDGQGALDVLRGLAEGTVNFVVNTAIGAYNLGSTIVEHGITSPETTLALATPSLVAAQEYQERGVSGVANALLDQGEQGAVAIVTEAVLTGGLVAAGRVNSVLPKGSPTPSVPTYNRAQHYGNPSTSTAAKAARAAGEGQPCPNCGQTMKSGTPSAPTAQHKPTLKQHYHQRGHKMTPAQRKAYARSKESLDKSICKKCQSKEGAVEAKKEY